MARAYEDLPDPAWANQEQDEGLGEDVATFHRLLHQAHRRFGTARLEIGALLEMIRQKGLWRGRALSFSAYLEEEKLKETAAYQYMRVARRLIFELRLSDEEIGDLSMVSMGLLDRAARAMTPENKEEIIGLLVCLNERDARVALEEFSEESVDFENQEGRSLPQRLSPAVAKIYREIRNLPDDLRIELLNRMRIKE